MSLELDGLTGCAAALYIRLSKEDDNGGESQSVTNQRDILRAFSEKHGLNVYDEYIDDGFSGGNFERPAFKRLLADIEAKRVNLVVTKDLSRLGRDYIQTGFYMERYFPEKRVRYISLLDGIDTGTEAAMNDVTPFRAIMNDMFARDISKKIKSVKHDKRRRGMFIGGKAPYGYSLVKAGGNTLVIDEDAAEIVRLIFKSALSGKSCREIASELNGQNIPPPAVYANLPAAGKSPYSGMWSAEGVAYTLKNQMYAGDMVQGRTKKVNYKSKKCVRIPKEQWIVVENTHPAIIGRDTFETVQTLINSRKGTRRRTHDYMLRGLVFCKECGYPLGVINRTLAGGSQTLYFICRTYQRFTRARLCTCHCIRVKTVTEAVAAHIEALCRQIISGGEFREAAKNAVAELEANSGREAEIGRISKQIAEKTSNIDRLYRDRLNGLLDDSDFTRLYIKQKTERSTLEGKLAALQTQDAAEPPGDIDKLTEGFISSAGQNRALLSSLIEKIELTEDKQLYIHFRCKKPDIANVFLDSDCPVAPENSRNPREIDSHDFFNIYYSPN